MSVQDRMYFSVNPLILDSRIANASRNRILLLKMAASETKCLFVSDLHGRAHRYEGLFSLLSEEPPTALFLGGDLLPHRGEADFLEDVFAPGFEALKKRLGARYPEVFLILGNDDPRCFEQPVQEYCAAGLWSYLHNRKGTLAGHPVYGYACVPPTPFQLKDWERYDVSRHVDPGCISPEEGHRTVSVEPSTIKWGTIQQDLSDLAGNDDLESAIFVIHTPPYDTDLDRAALDGKTVDHVPFDVHVGSIAVRRFIEARQPRLTLHGHVHESARLTGQWKIEIGRTVCINAAHDGPELAVIRFDPAAPGEAVRELL